MTASCGHVMLRKAGHNMGKITDQVLGPTQLELHLERRENAIVDPRAHLRRNLRFGDNV